MLCILCVLLFFLGTAACEKLSNVILAPRLLRDLQKLSGEYQTSSLESFHSLLIRFAPKSVAFSYVGMLCRYVVCFI